MPTFGFETTGDEVVDHFRDRISGKTILITGASAKGLGAETAVSLARGGPSHLILLARSANKVDPVIEEIKKVDSNIQAHFVPVELDKLSSIADAVKKIKDDLSISKIDIIINNAGIMATPYRKNDAGFESQLATNHIGHFYLTNQLQPLIAAAGPNTRIVNLTSDGYQLCGFRFEDYNFSDGSTYHPWSGYGQAKTANILFTRYLAQNLAHVPVHSFAVHPGVIMTTSLSGDMDHALFNELQEVATRNTGAGFAMGKPKTAQQGIATTLVAALDPDMSEKSGSYMVDCTTEPARDYAASDENAKKLWQLSEQWIGNKWDLSSW